MSKIKERTCIVCGEKEMKDNLLRWVFAQGKIHPDWTQKLPGRSLYTHFNRKCMEGIYDRSRTHRQLVDENTVFAVGRDKIFDHVKDLASASLHHFFSLGIKSGVLVKGQNLLEDLVKKGDVFKVCFTASDISPRTLKNMERLFEGKLIKTVLKKEDIGNFIDGRPVGVVAFVDCAITEKVCFYMNLINKFRSGDIDAH